LLRGRSRGGKVITVTLKVVRLGSQAAGGVASPDVFLSFRSGFV